MTMAEDNEIDICLNINSSPIKPDDLHGVSVHVLNTNVRIFL
jgi:hypothetical protein